MTQKEKLLAQSEAIKNCVKHLKEKIKKEQQSLKIEEAEYSHFRSFDDCGDYYESKVKERKTRIEILMEEKISLEKYSKKLRHMAEEAEEE